jgi:predicted HAD superfamily Cof-like phosphohydrolase
MKEMISTLTAERDELAAKLAVYADPKNWAMIDDVSTWEGPGDNGWDIANSVDPVHFDPVRDIRQFHEYFGLEYTGKPRTLGGGLGSFRNNFMHEELEEYEDAWEELIDRIDGQWPYPDNDGKITKLLETQLDSLVDLVYVVLGTAYLQGFNFKEAWRRVHEANMMKVRAERDSDSKRGSTFDVIKPEGWQPPDHSDLVADHAHKE